MNHPIYGVVCYRVTLIQLSNIARDSFNCNQNSMKATISEKYNFTLHKNWQMRKRERKRKMIVMIFTIAHNFLSGFIVFMELKFVCQPQQNGKFINSPQNKSRIKWEKEREPTKKNCHCIKFTIEWTGSPLKERLYCYIWVMPCVCRVYMSK